jgi:hypothetical protein
MILGSTEPPAPRRPPAAGPSARSARSGVGTSRRRRRHREILTFSAVRTTHAAGAGCLLTVRHDAQALAKASSTRSCAASRSPALTRTMNRHSFLNSR